MRIGIVTPWCECGIAYVSLDMYNTLAEHHDVFVLTRPKSNPIGPEWDVPNVEAGDVGSFRFPLDWAQRKELDMLIFNERLDFGSLRKLRGHGFKLVCLHEWESVSPQMVKAQNACWDGIIAPTRCAYERFVEMGLENVYHVPWGTDLELFHPPAEPRTGPIRFFQPVNFGGVQGRKNVMATKKAWAEAYTGDATLTLAQQRKQPGENANIIIRQGTLLRPYYAALYREADVVLLPSMWEGLGLCFMEALASGCAIVTVDAPPMSDYVTGGTTGYRCATEMAGRVGGIYVKRALIDVGDYTQVIKYMTRRPTTTRFMGPMSRALAEERYDWGKKRAGLRAVIEEIANG